MLLTLQATIFSKAEWRQKLTTCLNPLRKEAYIKHRPYN